MTITTKRSPPGPFAQKGPALNQLNFRLPTTAFLYIDVQDRSSVHRLFSGSVQQPSTNPTASVPLSSCHSRCNLTPQRSA
eukprot:1809424-Amphidinium_carterae.1